MKKGIKQTVFAGILAVLPFALTVLILLWLFRFFAKPGARILEYIFVKQEIPKYVPELLGFILTFLFIYILGLIVRNVLGKRLITKMENAISRIPVVNSIFNTIKQITSTISEPREQAFQKVVLVEYPRIGIWTIMMVTGSSQNKSGKEFYQLFVPTTPNPTSGYMLIVPKSDVVETNLTIEDGLKAIISGGLLAGKINSIPDLVEGKEL
ncbi:MAG: DUF502 domain-containing protein [Candidatus Marinimicrobia bacterium]|nr:DUF502 domain-containing protein [Candidatus Neomarinimicrobiota bacterium]